MGLPQADADCKTGGGRGVMFIIEMHAWCWFRFFHPLGFKSREVQAAEGHQQVEYVSRPFRQFVSQPNPPYERYQTALNYHYRQQSLPINRHFSPSRNCSFQLLISANM